jgi:hypothetical protein
MASQPDMFASSEELFHHDLGDSDSSWRPDSSQDDSSQKAVKLDKDKLFLVSLGAILSLFT